MRYPEAHAARSGSVPFMLHGPKSLRTVLATAVASAIGLVPVVFAASPASAADPNLTVTNNGPVTEGANLVFTLTAGVGMAFPKTYTITTTPALSDGAVAGDDYTALTVMQQSVVFSAAGAQQITIPTTDDALYENAESFTLTATSGGDFVDSPATINDNDSKPSYTLTASPTTVTESAGAKSTITATLSKVSGVATTIGLNTADGTAHSGTAPAGDYTALVSPGAPNDEIIIPAGQTTGTKEVSITNDAVKDEYDTESFTVSGLGVNVLPTIASTSVSVKDAQSLPKLTLSGGGQTNEGSNATFTVTTDTKSELPITVQWDSVETTPASGNGTAAPGYDFTYPANRSVTIGAGQTSTTITVATLSDSLDESNEDYAIQLSNPTNAALSASIKATGTIVDAVGDLGPTVSLSPSSVTEGDSGKKWATFTASLSSQSGKTVKVNWATANGTALAGKDYTAANGQLVFAPGTTTQSFAVEIVGDTIDEGAGEAFTINTTAVPGETPASLSASGPATVTITDDDAAPTLASFDDKLVKEGSEPWVAVLPIKLSNASDHAIKLDVTDTPGTASNTIAGVGSYDYTLLNSTVTIPPEMTTGWVAVLVNGDAVFEGDETTSITAAAQAGVDGQNYMTSPFSDSSTLTLQNDDKAPDLEVNSVIGKEGETVGVKGTVTGQSQTSTVVNVTFIGGSVEGSKAADNNDFSNPGVQPITIDAGTEPGTIVDVVDIPLTADSVGEPAETIIASGFGVGNIGTVTDGIITIAANGTTPEEPGGEEPGEAPKPTITAPASVNGTGPVSITGTVAANATVELWGAPVAGGDLKWIANTKAGTTGSYSFSRSISQGMRFVTQSQEVNSDEKTVWVNQWASLTASSPSRGRVTVLVRTNPNASGRKVVVQRWTGPNTWTNILVSRANVNGAYTATTWAPRGLVALRAWVEGDADMGINTGWTGIVRPVIR